jgi:carbon storage regulator
MLVLTRKPGEQIMIGSVTMTVVGVHGDRVRLAFEAPREVPIHRQEVYTRIQAELLAQGHGQASPTVPEFA